WEESTPALGLHSRATRLSGGAGTADGARGHGPGTRHGKSPVRGLTSNPAADLRALLTPHFPNCASRRRDSALGSSLFARRYWGITVVFFSSAY
ncbi:hypothetical protein TNCT_20131, partial [Trichonephila clavata]